MYDGYKATRHGMPEELAQQMPVLKELLADLGYRTVTAEGWEADDILGTLAAACAARKDDCFLATGDRDSLQLVSDTTTVLLAATVMGRSKTVTMDVDAIQEKYGIQPRQLIEVKSLMGDASDNIPGVKGIGEKTALTLVQNFGTLEGVYEHIDDKLIKPKQREHLLECREMAQLSHTLGTIRTDAPIDTAEGTYTVGEGNKAEAVRLLQELEIHSLIPRFGLDGIAPAAPEEENGIELAEAELEALPLTPSGTYLVASRPAVMGKQGTRNVTLQPESWYAVQDTTVYPLEDADLLRLLDNADVTLDVFNSAPLYARAMAAGGWGSSIVWDGKLAAYLLDASASKYQISELTASYRAAAAFTCADYPDAGRLADLFCKMKAEITACGEDSLYNEIEFPLAQVLADMTRTGVLVDKDGIEQFGVKLRTELEHDAIHWGKYAWDENYRDTARMHNTWPTGSAPCKAACPAHVPVQAYLQKAKEGKYQEAVELIRTMNPFPAVCGRICNKRCEDACTRGTIDQPVSIDAVKKFVADYDLAQAEHAVPNRAVPSVHDHFDQKIAIIGAGPAGWRCLPQRASSPGPSLARCAA